MNENVRRRNHLARAVRLQRILHPTFAAPFRFKKVTDAAGARGICEHWAKSCNAAVGLNIHIKGTPFTSEPCLYVANHVSYLDITVLMSMLPLTFVAKKELAKWPIFGPGATSAGTVYIDRSSPQSRAAVSDIIGRAITKERKSIGIFPEGTSSMSVRPWKRGAFSVAQDFGFKVQPVRIAYKPLRDAAFIGDDALLPHLWNLLGFEQVDAHLEFFEPTVIKNAEQEATYWEQKVRDSFETFVNT